VDVERWQGFDSSEVKGRFVLAEIEKRGECCNSLKSLQKTCLVVLTVCGPFAQLTDNKGAFCVRIGGQDLIDLRPSDGGCVVQ